MLMIIVAVLYGLISGCAARKIINNYEAEKREIQDEEWLKEIRYDWPFGEYEDTETGVHYFYTGNGGLELRVNADGSPYTGKD